MEEVLLEMNFVLPPLVYYYKNMQNAVKPTINDTTSDQTLTTLLSFALIQAIDRQFIAKRCHST